MARIGVIPAPSGAATLDPDLETIGGLAPANDDVLQRKGGAWTNRTPAQLAADLPAPTLDADLTAIAALTPANDDVIQRKAGAWTNRTPAQLVADLGISASPFTRDGAGDVIIPTDTTDSWVVGSDRLSRDAAAGTAKDNRAFYNKTNGAFRAGAATGTQWDVASQGARSHAEGLDTTASGTASHAEGNGTVAQASSSHAEGGSTVASSAYAHAEGYTSTASGAQSHAEGNGTAASGSAAHAQGSYTTASGSSSHAEGNQSQATGQMSHAQGWMALAPRIGQHAHACGQFVTPGDAQASVLVAHRTTTDATAATLFLDGGTTATLSGEGTNVLNLATNRAYRFQIDVVARRSDVSADAAGWEFSGLIVRGTGGVAASFVGSVRGNSWGTAGAAAWDVTLSIDATNHYLVIAVTGAAAQTIRWVAAISITEVG